MLLYCIQSEGLVDKYFPAIVSMDTIRGLATNSSITLGIGESSGVRFRVFVGHSLCCDIDLHDPRWRVAPQGWFSDE